MQKRIFVDRRLVIQKRVKAHRSSAGPLVVLDADGGGVLAEGLDILDRDENVVARVVFSPDNLLRSEYGETTVWIEADNVRVTKE